MYLHLVAQSLEESIDGGAAGLSFTLEPHDLQLSKTIFPVIALRDGASHIPGHLLLAKTLA